MTSFPEDVLVYAHGVGQALGSRASALANHTSTDVADQETKGLHGPQELPLHVVSSWPPSPPGVMQRWSR